MPTHTETWTAIVADITQSLSDGSWKKKSIEVNGDKIEFSTIGEVTKFLNYAKSQLTEDSTNPYSTGRIITSSNGMGLY